MATLDYQALECSSPFHELKIQIPDYQDLSYSVAFGAMTGAKHIVELLNIRIIDTGNGVCHASYP